MSVIYFCVHLRNVGLTTKGYNEWPSGLKLPWHPFSAWSLYSQRNWVRPRELYLYPIQHQRSEPQLKVHWMPPKQQICVIETAWGNHNLYVNLTLFHMYAILKVKEIFTGKIESCYNKGLFCFKKWVGTLSCNTNICFLIIGVIETYIYIAFI